MKPRALAAELFGTFGLTLAVLISINNPDFPIPTPVIAGLTLGIFVYTIGSISGCHVNPAVTIGLASIGKIDVIEAAAYIVSQFVAVVLGRVPEAMSGIVIGSSFTLGIHFAVHTSNGVLNPAVALGIGSFGAPYIWGPIVGAALGAWISTILIERKQS